MTEFTPHQLMTSIIDDVAEKRPESIWLEWLASEHQSPANLKSITYGALARAVDWVARKLHENVEKRADFETVIYIGPNDAMYAIIIYACVKAGYKVLFTSPRNSLDAHLKLISTCDCKHLVIPGPAKGPASKVAAAGGLSVLSLPSLEELCADASNGTHRPFPFSKTWLEAKQDPFVILHTSGTTGHPKPITFTHEYFARCVIANNWPAPDGYSSMNSLVSCQKSVSMMPLFHVAGVFNISILPLYNQTVTILPPPGAPPTSHTLVSILKHASAESAAISPATVDCLARNESGLRFVEHKLQRLFFMGGVPTAALAAQVAKRIRLYSGIGSSECGPFAQLIPYPEDYVDTLWPYIRLNPSMNGRFEQQAAGLHELVFQRKKNDEQPVFLLFPDQVEYRTKDVFSPHPTLPGLWRYQGRVDDIIVFSHGEKFNPVSYESRVNSHAQVTGALMFGSGQFEAGLLIECNVSGDFENNTDSRADSTADDIWHTVQAANKACPDFAVVARSHIIYTSPSKLMLRTGKGTVRRHITLDLYKEEIQNLYKRGQQIAGPVQWATEVPEDHEAMIKVLRSSIEMTIEKPVLSDDENFFEMGMNSLMITRLVHRLQHLKGLSALSGHLIYSHPTVAALANAIFSYLLKPQAEETSKKKAAFRQTLDEYKKRISRSMDEHSGLGSETSTTGNNSTDTKVKHTVLLTGSTGSLGSYILDRLMSHATNPRVYCLNRSSNGALEQSLRNKERNPDLASSFPADRVTFLCAEKPFESMMSLDIASYETLLASTTLVIHNAWPVDFTQPFSFFQPSLEGLLNVIKFCKHAKHSPRLLFVSSVGVAMNLFGSTIPAAPLNEMSDRISGYGESKLVAEHMLNHAAQSLSGGVTVVRVGQIAGAADSLGIWNPRDWLPRLITTSRYLKMIPDGLGASNDIDWIPIDQTAQILIELAFGFDTIQEFRIFHVLNPHRTRWEHLLPVVHETLQEDLPEDHRQIKIVAAKHWIKTLRAVMTDAQGHEKDWDQKYPALPLVDFFEELLGAARKGILWELETTIPKSRAMQSMRSIQLDWMQRWTRQWLQPNKPMDKNSPPWI